MVHAKLIIRPAPDELANAICDKKERNEAKKEGAICRGEFGERMGARAAPCKFVCACL